MRAALEELVHDFEQEPRSVLRYLQEDFFPHGLKDLFLHVVQEEQRALDHVASALKSAQNEAERAKVWREYGEQDEFPWRLKIVAYYGCAKKPPLRNGLITISTSSSGGSSFSS